MLVLTRKVGQKIMLEMDCQRVADIEIVSMKNGQVRLGIVAPASVHIVREELLDGKDQRAEAAA